MAKRDKALRRFAGTQGPFTWKEVAAVLKALGFSCDEAQGSRVLFSRGGIDVILHRPHPGNEVKAYVVRQLKEKLRAENLI